MPEYEYLDIISANMWQALISLANLLILFLILKKFLYKPVKKMLSQRQASIEQQYKDAEEAKAQAQASEAEWAEKLETANQQAEAIYSEATANAQIRGEKIVAEAREKADVIMRRAENEAELEKLKAADGIRKEIVVVSTQLAEKMLDREINEEDHRELINSFIQDIGETK